MCTLANLTPERGGTEEISVDPVPKKCVRGRQVDLELRDEIIRV